MEDDIMRLLSKDGYSITELQSATGATNTADRKALQAACTKLVEAGKLRYVDKKNKYFLVDHVE